MLNYVFRKEFAFGSGETQLEDIASEIVISNERLIMAPNHQVFWEYKRQIPSIPFGSLSFWTTDWGSRIYTGWILEDFWARWRPGWSWTRRSDLNHTCFQTMSITNEYHHEQHFNVEAWTEGNHWRGHLVKVATFTNFPSQHNSRVWCWILLCY